MNDAHNSLCDSIAYVIHGHANTQKMTEIYRNSWKFVPGVCNRCVAQRINQGINVQKQQSLLRTACVSMMFIKAVAITLFASYMATETHGNLFVEFGTGVLHIE